MITGINHITLSVRSLEESFEFYQNVLGLDPNGHVGDWQSRLATYREHPEIQFFAE
jgi:catechol 2,3-dioxygenase-like lactoylglutathione lyase family enzyme